MKSSITLFTLFILFYSCSSENKIRDLEFEDNSLEYQQGLVHWNQTNECYRGDIKNKSMKE